MTTGLILAYAVWLRDGFPPVFTAAKAEEAEMIG
jgi:hypothetical protein